MNSFEFIQVGILSSENIQFSFDGIFTSTKGKDYTGMHSAKSHENELVFDNELSTELLFDPLDAEASFVLYDVVIGIGFHWERKENQRFKGALRVIVKDGQLICINKIRVEDYLLSVISSEMSPTASMELLKAHAVISRSWLLCPLQNPVVPSRIPNSSLGKSRYINYYERDAHAYFDVCADDHCQRYQGINKATTQVVGEAIEATRGEVLVYDGKICDARFSKSCGGVSETFENCWAEEHHPYLSKVVDNSNFPVEFNMDLTLEENAQTWIRKSPDAFCNTTDAKILSQVLNNYDQETKDFYRWKVEYTQAELSALIARKSGIDFGEIIDLMPIRRGESSRLIELKIVGTNQTLTVGKELEIRKWLSNSHLYSSAFVVDKSDVLNGIPQCFTLTGAGWGHGVGLCQIGAAVMGEKGCSYTEILLHYFRGATLERVY